MERRIDQLVLLGQIVGPPSEDAVTVLHTDLQPKNVLVTSSGFALLDWDDAALCPPVRVLARALVEWLTPGGVRPERIAAFFEAYRAAGGRTVIDTLEDFGFAAAAFLNYLHELIVTDLSDDQRHNESARRVAAALTTPLEVSTLQLLLELATTTA